jgi:hypothetical protein
MQLPLSRIPAGLQGALARLAGGDWPSLIRWPGRFRCLEGEEESGAGTAQYTYVL